MKGCQLCAGNGFLVCQAWIHNGLYVPVVTVSEEKLAELYPLKSCDHEYVEYIGLVERYNYCKKCDEKQR